MGQNLTWESSNITWLRILLNIMEFQISLLFEISHHKQKESWISWTNLMLSRAVNLWSILIMFSHLHLGLLVVSSLRALPPNSCRSITISSSRWSSLIWLSAVYTKESNIFSETLKSTKSYCTNISICSCSCNNRDLCVQRNYEALLTDSDIYWFCTATAVYQKRGRP